MTDQTRKPRVLLVLHELSHSGAPKLILDLFDELKDSIEIRCVAVQGGPLAPRCRALGRLDILPRMPMGGPMADRLGPRVVGGILAALRASRVPLSRSIARWQPDIVYFNSVWSAPASLIVTMPQKPSIMHVHELEIGIALAVRQYGDAVVKNPAHLIAVSDAVGRALLRDHGVDPARVSVVHAAVPDSYAAQNLETISEDRAPERAFVVGGSGSPYWRKGIFLFLQVARNVVNKMGAEAVKFQWIGIRDPNEMIMCRESARKLGVEDSVEFVAATPAPLTWFRRFDLFAMTSIEDPCPIVVLENMMLGTPVVCFTEGGGAVEEIGDTGVAIPGFNVSAMADSIVALANDRARLQSLGAQASARVRTHFTASVQAPKILAVINDLAGLSGVVE